MRGERLLERDLRGERLLERDLRGERLLERLPDLRGERRAILYLNKKKKRNINIKG